MASPRVRSGAETTPRETSPVSVLPARPAAPTATREGYYTVRPRHHSSISSSPHLVSTLPFSSRPTRSRPRGRPPSPPPSRHRVPPHTLSARRGVLQRVLHRGRSPPRSSSDRARVVSSRSRLSPSPQVPSKEKLLALARSRSPVVRAFAVGRVGVGCVTWANPVDLRDVPLDALDDVVEITRGQVSVYDGASRATKPSRGVGLNAPAIVALDGIFPPGVGVGAEDDIEGSGSDVVTEDDRVDALVRRLKRARGTRFIAYDAKSGTWRFRVEHFTRYGLDVDASDDDDDDDDFSEEEEGGGLEGEDGTSIDAYDERYGDEKENEMAFEEEPRRLRGKVTFEEDVARAEEEEEEEDATAFPGFAGAAPPPPRTARGGGDDDDDAARDETRVRRARRRRPFRVSLAAATERRRGRDVGARGARASVLRAELRDRRGPAVRPGDAAAAVRGARDAPPAAAAARAAHPGRRRVGG
ncbi:uncharacterized protein MICPUCDRAFT_51078 [Micromonas pusilla CCMP1545]|uniref:Predicted protein n=1 Tax=Micromonas pusilla (strain CCMP1545) TaxID=564608 RepID=C1N0M7_MICPC|nr:uncharacterized protein MICPUCDRAFT_51078 [Micromonas pusilla CCMP1545]EEH54044.1 predicted protein [Micromonas pusilla CCMP1545]|eukprot:XP_003061414.1 predicted protein [Micromonas pusilla CCMP1545]